MYTKYRYSPGEMLQRLWKGLLFMLIYATFIFSVFSIFDYRVVNVPLSIPTVLGTAISLLLGFRTNAAYNRWWEARQVWGAIVNDSRTLIRQANGFVSDNYSEKKQVVQKLARLQIAFNYALSNSLRKLSTEQELNAYLTEEEKQYVTAQNNHHNAILQLEENLLSRLHKEGHLNTYQFSTMDGTLKSLCNAMGKCERIKNTVFPMQYSYYTRMVIIIFMVILPFGLIKDTGLMVIPISFVVVFFFSVIDLIARYLQDPFENKPSDTPMTALCRTIEINLMQLSGIENVPEPIQPNKYGILM